MPHMPNPPFVFPARDPDDTTPLNSATEAEGRTPPPLPAFSFNPGSDPLPPPNNVPSRPNGHRRRPSEFVGGDQLVTPPLGDGEKRDDPLGSAQPTAPGVGPGRGPGRRGHAHRRSAAVSGVDLNAIQKALIPNSGPESTPSTPGDHLANKSQEDISRPLSHSGGSLGRPTPPASPRFASALPVPDIPPVPPIPAEINVQPAPSDDDEKPARPISAIFRPAPESPASVHFEPREEPTPPLINEPPPDRKLKPRPKTADASLAMQLAQSQQASQEQESSIKRSKSTGTRRARKSMSNLLDVALMNHGSDDAHSTDTSRQSFSDDGSETASDDDDDDESKPRSKSKKKQKRVRSWAGSLLTRKSKHHKKEKARPPALTPPALSRTNSDVGSAMDVDFDNDVVVIRTPTHPEAPRSVPERAAEDNSAPAPVPAPAPAPSLETAWKPSTFYEQTAQDNNTLSSPVIDLDAALGPFNTPDMRPAKTSKFLLATQNMYSGGRRGEFVGPEMRFHRRTESAPVMQPFDRNALIATRLGGAAPETPDVFYEEEEDAFLAANQSPKNELAVPKRAAAAAVAESQTGTASHADDEKSIKSAKSNDSADTLTRAPKTESIPSSRGLGIQSTVDRPSSGSQSEDAGQDTIETLPLAKNPSPVHPRSPVEVLKSEECAPKPRAPPSPDVSPRYLAVDKRPATSPNELLPSIQPFSLSGSAGVSPSDSSFPSPDVPRFSDRNFSSYSYQHLPSEYQYASVEDVPSLTSSASTMTNTLGRFSASFFPRARLSTDRAASFSAAVHRRSSQTTSSKRSSLASLSKLVGGPNSERSKLNQEEKPPSDTPDRTKRKGRRLNRLMHFWKVKDKERAASDTAGPSEPSV